MRNFFRNLLSKKPAETIVVTDQEQTHNLMECITYASNRINDVGRHIRLCKTHLILHHLDLPKPPDFLGRENTPE